LSGSTKKFRIPWNQAGGCVPLCTKRGVTEIPVAISNPCRYKRVRFGGAGLRNDRIDLRDSRSFGSKNQAALFFEPARRGSFARGLVAHTRRSEAAILFGVVPAAVSPCPGL